MHDADGRSDHFAAVIWTPQVQLLETGVDLRSTTPGSSPLGPRMWRAVRRVTYWDAAKTSLVVREPFWEGTTLDGVTLTDRLPRATYTSDYGPARAPGGRRAVLDLSFTWSHDSAKVAASSAQERAELFVRDLSRIHPSAAQALRTALDEGEAVTCSWQSERHVRGIARFSRPGEHPYQRDLFNHFMKDFTGTPAVPGEPRNALFLAGDDTSWSPGWLEHALTSGINAAWGVLTLLGGATEPDNPGPGDLWSHPDYRPLSLDT